MGTMNRRVLCSRGDRTVLCRATEVIQLRVPEKNEVCLPTLFSLAFCKLNWHSVLDFILL